MRHIRTLYIFLSFILLSSTPFLHAATEQRTALVIGNSNYSSGDLKNPVNDATDMAMSLQSLGFSVIIKWQNVEEEKAALEAKKSTTMAMAKRPSVSTGNEIKRDGRFIIYDNGTVLDTSTNLMWAARDNGSIINWANAKSYCENYRGGGYTDWRMPTQDELARLYESGNYANVITLTSWWVWASETRGSEATRFYFNPGSRFWLRHSGDNVSRALPVRYVK